MILETKRHTAAEACQIVSDSSRWLKAQLKGAGVPFQYGACEKDDQSTYASFTIVREAGDQRIVFEMKVAEIDHVTYAFVDVHPMGKPTERLFPFFGEIGSEEGRKHILHYIADFLLGTEKEPE